MRNWLAAALKNRKISIGGGIDKNRSDQVQKFDGFFRMKLTGGMTSIYIIHILIFIERLGAIRPQNIKTMNLAK